MISLKCPDCGCFGVMTICPTIGTTLQCYNAKCQCEGLVV